MKLMKRMLSAALLLAIVLGCAACSGGSAKEAAASDQSAFTWQIELRQAELRESLHTDAGVTQYDGDVLDVAYDDAPAEGEVYLILTLTVTKAVAGGGAFEWGRLCVRDADGNSYGRMENDAFLASHTYKRMPGTALQIGENKGSICFELPADAAKGALTLVYDAGDEGENALPVAL